MAPASRRCSVSSASCGRCTRASSPSPAMRWALRVVGSYRKDILFVPQKPYLVLGTLCDQIIYPHSREDMQKNGGPALHLTGLTRAVSLADLEKLLNIVDPTRTILGQWSWDDIRDWFTYCVHERHVHSRTSAFSGGQ